MSRTVVIGGGIVGCCTAYFLAGHGEVVVLEKDPSYQYASTTLSAASFRSQFSLPLNVRMSLFGAAFLEAMAERVGLVRRGYLVLAGAEDAATLRVNRAMQLAEGADVALFEGAQIAARFPWLNAQDVACATLGLKHEGWFDAYSLLRAVRADAIGRGARCLHDEAVAIDVAAGRATTVRTTNGERIAADHVVIAAGPASGRVAAFAGIVLPIEPRKRTVFVIRAPLDGTGMPLVFDTSGMWIRPEGDGFICGISPPADTDHDPAGDFDPDLHLLEDPLWPLLAHRIPALEQLRLQRAWAGHYDMCLLDHNAVIGPFPEIPNLIVASGFSGHGVQHGPATGRAVAEMIRFGDYRTLDLTPLGYERVRDNRPLPESVGESEASRDGAHRPLPVLARSRLNGFTPTPTNQPEDWMPSARLAVDIGGTFTDLALEHDGRRSTIKVLTTPAAPEQGVMAGVRDILQVSGVVAADIGIVIHGTTLATNAVIERKGARTALLTTQGFRDVIAMGNESRYDQYDLNIVLPEPLVPRHLRLPLAERMDNEGNVLLPLDSDAVRALIPTLQREQVESIAVGLLHAFVNPAHERRVRDVLAEELPDIPVSLSSEVSPEMREWERFSTTVANAYVQPLMSRYLRELADGLRDMGIAAPVFLMLSGGGLTTIDTACRFPIRLAESGPAGGAIFSATIARQCGIANVLSFDMGGTTAKICLIDDGKPQTARAFEIARVGRFRKGSGLPLRIPVIEMVEIGAGGGSIAHVDAMGRIAVGPESAGADPGPACYGRGGTEPAVTDANLVLGRYDPARFAGGTMRLHAAAAHDALAARVGSRLGLPTEMAALGVIEMVDENMANAARVHAIESGKTYEGRTLIAFGGGGPVHACRVAEKVGIRHVLVPSGAGVGSAIGFLRAPVGYEVVRSLYQRFSTFDVVAVNTLLADMEAEALEVVAQGSFGAPTTQRRIAYMRYVGQGHEIPVPLPSRPLGEEDVPLIRAAYDAEYTRFYDRPVPGSDVEIMSYAALVATVPEDDPGTPVAGDDAVFVPDATPVRTQLVRDTTTGEIAPWSAYDRATLAPGVHIAGPAIIAEDETSTLVCQGWNATVNGLGYIELTRETT